MNLKIRKVLVLITFVILIFSCGGGGNSLSGSVSDYSWWNLGFDRVMIQLYQEGLAISYQRDVSGSADADRVAEIWVLTAGTAIRADEDIDMAVYGKIDRNVRVRDTNGSLIVDDHDFGGISKGTIRFSSIGKDPGVPIAGKFYLLLINGNTLNGSFSGDLISQM